MSLTFDYTSLQCGADARKGKLKRCPACQKRYDKLLSEVTENLKKYGKYLEKYAPTLLDFDKSIGITGKYRDKFTSFAYEAAFRAEIAAKAGAKRVPVTMAELRQTSQDALNNIRCGHCSHELPDRRNKRPVQVRQLCDNCSSVYAGLKARYNAAIKQATCEAERKQLRKKRDIALANCHCDECGWRIRYIDKPEKPTVEVPDKVIVRKRARQGEKKAVYIANQTAIDSAIKRNALAKSDKKAKPKKKVVKTSKKGLTKSGMKVYTFCYLGRYGNVQATSLAQAKQLAAKALKCLDLPKAATVYPAVIK